MVLNWTSSKGGLRFYFFCVDRVLCTIMSSAAVLGLVSWVNWLFSFVSSSFRSAARRSFSELNAAEFGLNIVQRNSSGSFFRWIEMSRHPYESVCIPSVSNA